MGYQKIMNLLKNTPSPPYKFRTKNWAEINDDLHGTYDINSQIRFKTSMLKSSLFDYSDAYILVKKTIKNARKEAGGAANEAAKRDKEVISKNCELFTECISKISNTQADSTRGVRMSMYNLIE